MTQNVNVTVLAKDQVGNPVANAIITVKLSTFEVENGYIFPEKVEVNADESGVAVIPLWPNELGSTKSVYEFRIRNPLNSKSLLIVATIPNHDCFLHDVADMPAYPGKMDNQVSVSTALSQANAAAIASANAVNTANMALDLVNESTAPAINFVGRFASNPLTTGYPVNSVYSNTTDGNSYVLSGSPLIWNLYLEGGVDWSVIVESSNGTAFKVGLATHTLLIGRVFRNGVEVTALIQESRFRWRRVSFFPMEYPNDDATWNSNYLSGYKQINVAVDDVASKATFHLDITDY